MTGTQRSRVPKLRSRESFGHVGNRERYTKQETEESTLTNHFSLSVDLQTPLTV